MWNISQFDGPMMRRLKALRRRVRRPAHTIFFEDLIGRTKDFGRITWLGRPIWQNILDLWTIQETISETQPELLIECGTNRGGSAFFYATLFDLLGRGRVVTIDVEKFHDIRHPRITFLIGSSVDPAIIEQVRTEAEPAAAKGPVMVILDSDHAKDHVAKELEAYAPMVTPDSYLLCQDGAIDTLRIFKAGRPGPLKALEEFLPRHPEFQVDEERCSRFFITHHPRGWLRRVGT